MAEIKITYEALFDLLRREKGRGELQQLDATFYDDVKEYIQEKKKTLITSSSRGEQEKIRIQLKNVKKILREIYELREKKIIILASSKVRTSSNLIDTSKVLLQEKELYKEACDLFQKYKTLILEKSLGEDASRYDYAPSKKTTKQEETIEERNQETIGERNQETTEGRTRETMKGRTQEKIGREELNSKQEETDDEEMQLIILHDLPRFLGVDKKIYGPYKKGEITNMSNTTAKLLLDKKRAKKT